MTSEELKAKWAGAFKPLEGRTIKHVRYMTAEEQKALGWFQSALVIVLDDGTALWPGRDDEGNDAGALFLQPSPAAARAGLEDLAPTI